MRRHEEARCARATSRLPAAKVMLAGIVSVSLLFMAATSAQAQAVKTPPPGLSDRPAQAAPAKSAALRNAKAVFAVKPLNCRIQAFRRGEQRVSYGTASPVSRRLLNDCSPLGAPI